MKSCEAYEAWISAFLDGELSGAEQAELMEHMSNCRVCQQYFDDLVAIHEALEGAEEAPVPEGFQERVMARVRETPQEKPIKVVRPTPWKRWAALAACCAVALVGLWSFQSRKADRSASQNAPAIPYMEEEADTPAGADENADVMLLTLDDGEPIMDEYMRSVSDEDAPEESLPEEAPETVESAQAAQKETSETAAAPSADSADHMEADEAPLAFGTLTAGGETARRWVENELGQAWESGRTYPLTEEQYSGLLESLTESGEDFQMEPGEVCQLLAA